MYKLTPIHEQMGQERYDFRMIYENFRSEWFEIVTCPHCCFSAFMDTFQLQEPPRKERYATKQDEVCAALPVDFTTKKNAGYCIHAALSGSALHGGVP